MSANGASDTGVQSNGGHDSRAPRTLGLQTLAVHAATAAGRVNGACVPPIFQAATFAFQGTEGGELSLGPCGCS